MARENARRLGLEGRVTFHHGDLLEPLAGLEGQIDLIVSNPPYVDPAERDALAPEVRDHEPERALFPPGDALSVYRRLVPASAPSLRGGRRPGRARSRRPSPATWPGSSPRPASRETVRPDLAGLARVVFGRRLAPAPATAAAPVE